ncbi:tyrosine-type recombinase/integrase [Hungatella hathewayi]|uniref:tyrosine-type recombinase/integrase n=1 Tax=Hungatella hathewayi TaxID=154046 RepID=UPI00311AAFD9
MKIQQQAFCLEEKELSRQEYIRLVKAARKSGNIRLEMILQTICCTGIRVSELCFVTVKAVRLGYAEVCCKGKNRRIMIPGNLRKKLLIYIQKNGIEKGEVFITKTGNAMDRSNIWRGMKRLAAEAGVLADKIFPHNLRHLFARSFYEIDKDIAKLADVLGHSSINTTRIYMISTGEEHRRQLERLRLVI